MWIQMLASRFALVNKRIMEIGSYTLCQLPGIDKILRETASLISSLLS